MTTRKRLALGLTVCFSLSAASQQQTPSVGSEKVEKTILVALAPDAPVSTVQALASIAAAKPIVAAKGESIAAVAKREVGEYGPIRATVNKMNADLVHDLTSQKRSAWAPLMSQTTVYVPDISVKRNVASIKVSASAKFEDVANRVYGYKGPVSVGKLRSANPALSQLQSVPAGAIIKAPNAPQLQVVTIKEGQDASAVVSRLQSLTGVKAVGLNNNGYLVKSIRSGLSSTPGTQPSNSTGNETSGGGLWYVNALHACDVTEHETDMTGDILIAVLDSGIATSHPAFAADLWKKPSISTVDDGSYVQTNRVGFDFVNYTDMPEDDSDDSHGTHVAGLASARAIGKECAAFRSEKLDQHLHLLILKVADSSGLLDAGTVTTAIDFAQRRGARIVVGSWNLIANPVVLDYMRRNPQILFVTAAGNGIEREINGSNVYVGQLIDSQHPIFPASYNLANQINVGATDENGEPAAFSNYGAPIIHIFAPGVTIQSTIRNAGYGTLSGTSQATPMVALAAAILLGHNGRFEVGTVKERLLYTADVTKGSGTLMQSGNLNLAKALASDTDVVELKSPAPDGSTFVHGTIRTTKLQFAVGDADCSISKTVDIVADNVLRLTLHASSNKALLVQPQSRMEGTICNSSIQLKHTDGALETIPVGNIRDLIWRLQD